MKQKVALATISLHNMAGGLERNIIRIANYLASRGYDTHLVTFDPPAAQAFFPIDPAVTWHKVGGHSTPHQKIGFFERLALIGRIRRIFKDSRKRACKTRLIAFHHGILVRLMLATVFKNVQIVCSERNSLRLYDHIHARKWNLNFFMLFFVKFIIVQFPRYVQDYPRLMRGRIAVIPNAVEPVTQKSDPAIPDGKGRFHILAVGRLSHQKNFECLIRAFAGLAKIYPQWDVHIAGEGGGRDELIALIETEHLQGRVQLMGAAADMDEIYRDAHIMCMPSRWEGFPNALAEALAHGLPAVGFADCAGVGDLIIDVRNGLLAAGNGDVAALQAALEKLMADAALRTRMGQEASETIAAYRPESVLGLWEDIIER